MTTSNWPARVGAMQAVLADARLRRLDIRQRVAYVNTYAMPLLLHLAQVIPCPAGIAARIGSAITAFVKKGQVFSVPLERLCRPHGEGGLSLLHHRWKPLSMFVGKWESAARQQQFSGAWLRTLQQLYDSADQVPSKVGYFRIFLQHRSKLTPLLTGRALARTVYVALLEENKPPPARVETLHPEADWPTIWSAANTKKVHPHLRAKYYLLLHDVIPTRSRLYSKKLADSPICLQCGKIDTLEHRLVECSSHGTQEWQECARRVARLLGLPMQELQPQILLRPDIHGDSCAEAAEILMRTATLLHDKWLEQSRFATSTPCGPVV